MRTLPVLGDVCLDAFPAGWEGIQLLQPLLRSALHCTAAAAPLLAIVLAAPLLLALILSTPLLLALILSAALLLKAHPPCE